VLEVIRGGGDTGRAPPQAAPRPPAAMEDFAIPPSAPQPAKPEPVAEPVAVASEPVPAPVAPPPAQSPGLAVNTGFQIRPGGFVTPEPKRTFSLFERLTGAARRESNEDS
jgi:hypothetical protein